MKLSDIFYPLRSGLLDVFAPNANDRLPVVYGDLSDGTNGTWVLPCLNSASYNYCFAAHPVLSVANGNSINIYVDGVLQDPALYEFDEDIDFIGRGYNIALITFWDPPVGTIVTATGMGKASGSVLIENIVDIINDFLTVENDWTSSLFDATSKARAAQLFDALGYKAAGVIAQDTNIDDLLTAMMGSFLGSWWIDGLGTLHLEIDNGAVPPGFAGIVQRSSTTFRRATQRLENIINEAPASYAYNYVQREYSSHTDDVAHADLASQGIFGVREPVSPLELQWCRDLDSVQTIQDIIVAKFAYPVWELEITDNTLNQIGADIGDYLIHTVDFLYDETGRKLYNQYWKILSVKPNYAKGYIDFRLLQTNSYLSYAVLPDDAHSGTASIQTAPTISIAELLGITEAVSMLCGTEHAISAAEIFSMIESLTIPQISANNISLAEVLATTESLVALDRSGNKISLIEVLASTDSISLSVTGNITFSSIEVLAAIEALTIVAGDFLTDASGNVITDIDGKPITA